MINEYKKILVEYTNQIDDTEITTASEAIKTAILRGSNIFIFGNGGSLSTAMHFAEDLMLTTHPNISVICLDNISALTAVANDYEYADVFAIQLKNMMNRNDLAIGISCSGDSPNVIKAIEYANTQGITIGISGFSGGKLKDISQVSIHVASKPGEYYMVETVHLGICHLLTALVRGRIT